MAAPFQPPTMKPLHVYLWVAFIVMDTVLVAYFLWPRFSTPAAESPPSGGAPQAQAQGKRESSGQIERVHPMTTPDAGEVGEASSPQPKTRDFLEELLGFAPDTDTGMKKTILFTGSELLEVEGAFIVEDEATGKVFVRGLKRVKILNGGLMETSGEASLSYDPAKGKAEVTAEHIKMTSPPSPP